MMVHYLLSAGGTGGHLFPAVALASELKRRGAAVTLATDARAARYAKNFPGTVAVVPSATISGRSPLAIAKAVWTLGKGYLAARKLVKTVKPAVAIGFGGYPTLPPLLAADHLNVPVLLHEQNMVFGRANKFLAKRAANIAISLDGTKAPAGQDAKLVLTGNPLRDAVLAAAELPYQAPDETGPLHLLVFGGSQGAAYFGETVPEAIAHMPGALRARLKIVQQCRDDDLARVQQAYQALGVQAELATFFDDMPAQIAKAHLVLCRSGASSAAELAAIGRPSLLVPYPYALDHDQRANAHALEAAGGAFVHEQAALTASVLSERLSALLTQPHDLVAAAQAAKAVGHVDAVVRLADLAEKLAGPANQSDTL